MFQEVPTPDTHRLLPPLLACLLTAFVSPQPPSALLPLLSPVLKQRVQILSDGCSSWLPLLGWDEATTKEVSTVIQNYTFELHPVSGEVELGDPYPPLFLRCDEETLQARIALRDLDLEVFYLWCAENDEGGECGWRISDLGVAKDDHHHLLKDWHSTVAAANTAFLCSRVQEASQPAPAEEPFFGASDEKVELSGNDDGEDAYWSRYDKVTRKEAADNTALAPQTFVAEANEQENPSDNAYYSQYEDVQPMLDADDSTQVNEPASHNKLVGKVLGPGSSGDLKTNTKLTGLEAFGCEPSSHRSIERSHTRSSETEQPVQQPNPTRPIVVSAKSSTLARKLENNEASRSILEMGVREYITSTVTSLQKLALIGGIGTEDFTELMKAEIEHLSNSAHR